MTEQVASFAGWAIVEMMGHRREIGYVTTEHYGAASLFRVDSPEFEEREWETTRPEYMGTTQGHKMVPAGSKVKRSGIPAKSCLIGPGAIYALNPCTEEIARQAIEEGIHRPLILLSVPDRPQLESSTAIDADYTEPCEDCGLVKCECKDFHTTNDDDESGGGGRAHV